jgi:hypothetical protein
VCEGKNIRRDGKRSFVNLFICVFNNKITALPSQKWRALPNFLALRNRQNLVLGKNDQVLLKIGQILGTAAENTGWLLSFLKCSNIILASGYYLPLVKYEYGFPHQILIWAPARATHNIMLEEIWILSQHGYCNAQYYVAENFRQYGFFSSKPF